MPFINQAIIQNLHRLNIITWLAYLPFMDNLGDVNMVVK